MLILTWSQPKWHHTSDIPKADNSLAHSKNELIQWRGVRRLSVCPSVCKLLRKSLLARKWPDRHQTRTRWSPGKRPSRVCSRSRSKVTWYAHFLGMSYSVIDGLVFIMTWKAGLVNLGIAICAYGNECCNHSGFCNNHNNTIEMGLFNCNSYTSQIWSVDDHGNCMERCRQDIDHHSVNKSSYYSAH